MRHRAWNKVGISWRPTASSHRSPLLQRSESARRSIRNAAYSVAEYLLSSLLMILAAPFLVSRLGVEHYGIWVLANALVGTAAVFPLALGDATIKYVSGYRGRNEQEVIRVVRSTLTLSVLLGAAVMLITLGTAPWLVQSVFKIATRDHRLAVEAIQLAAMILVLRSADSVFLSTLRGYERYDLTAKVAMAVRTATVGVAVVLVALGYGVVEILLATLTVSAAGAATQAILSRRLVEGLSFWPLLDRAALRKVFGFGMYSWIQGVGGVIFGQVYLLLIGALLGSAELTYYVVPVQLAQQIHALPAAAFSFVFPLVSNRYESKGRGGLRTLFLRCAFLNALAAAGLAIPLIFFSRPVLSLWMGTDFAAQADVLLAILAVAYAVLSINVVPHNTLLGLGQVRFVSMVNLAGGMLSVVGAAALLPLIGLNGAAVGQLLYGLAISVNYLRVARSL
jgi:O-antigen/teichoic acid export membrane protein